MTVFDLSPVEGSFFIDTTVGKETSFTVTFSSDVNITLTSPAGVTLSSLTHPQHFKMDHDSGVVKVVIPGLAQVRLYEKNGYTLIG